jgi:competence protein ComEA
MLINPAKALWMASFYLFLTSGLVQAETEGKLRNNLEACIEVVNINQADAATIAATLEGIGLRRAKAIVEYRTRYGRFFSAEELSAVKGVGLKTVERNAHRIRLDGRELEERE